jgi:predicted transcriptional regulator
MFTTVVELTTGVIKEWEVRLSKSDDNKPERISEAEYAVMEVLWDKGTVTAADVCDEVCEARGWSLPTVKTLLSRLVQKQAIEARPDGRRYLYSAVIARSDYVGGESRRLVDRLFGGKASSLFAHLAEQEALTEDDLAAIEALLKELKQ